MMYAGLFYLGVNIWLFILMGVDKKRAREQKWRIPEKQLWLAALLGGAFGGVLGMKVFRHKTKHKSFTVGFPLLIAAHGVLIWYLYVRFYT
ncbi:DUF1294 domain-containing protein [Halobacillus kuroshimensis]|uniref:DUF1294 domain-containing protein n=1 Tax=Halobacillus kuroshimensis TaxID=302481 RepID=A0ABS3DZY4_9BACI|nr:MULTISPECIES: DUF1294 domain-containing protein [Halobacillus]MBN8236894.1 DUF1294 domain-containing protein [Halobacillus kuroshimensis]